MKTKKHNATDLIWNWC